jgi:RHS repeat-associated protein
MIQSGGFHALRARSNRQTNGTWTYTRGLDVSGTLQGAGGIGGMLARSHGYSGGSWSTHNFYHADGMGNITFMVDNNSQNPAMAAKYKYDPYGRTISSTGPLAAANLYRFSSKEINLTSGTYYFGYRFYNPAIQRWMNRESTAEAPAAVNQYTYYEDSALILYQLNQVKGRQKGQQFPRDGILRVGLGGGTQNVDDPDFGKLPDPPSPGVPSTPPSQIPPVPSPPNNEPPPSQPPVLCLVVVIPATPPVTPPPPSPPPVEPAPPVNVVLPLVPVIRIVTIPLPPPRTPPTFAPPCEGPLCPVLPRQ